MCFCVCARTNIVSCILSLVEHAKEPYFCDVEATPNHKMLPLLIRKERTDTTVYLLAHVRTRTHLYLICPTLHKVICAIMDVPVYDNLIESLHVIFSLYMEFKDNPHFAARSKVVHTLTRTT